jgi:hypothetical protein
MRKLFCFSVVGASFTLAALLLAGPTSAAPKRHLTGPTVYFANLSSAGEAAPSPATGSTTVSVDTAAHTLRVQAVFSGLLGTTTASHIHACTAVSGTGNAGVATTTPTFAGFPLGVTSGTYDRTLDMTLPTSYNVNGFLNAQAGGNVAAAEALLASCIAQGRAYLNIHSTFAPGGEIRGILAPLTKDACKGGGFATILDPRTGDYFRNQGQCVSFVATGAAG